MTVATVPYAEYVQSELSWLGQIPKHWNVVRLSKLSTKITNGYVGPTRGLFVEEGVPYLQSLHIKQNAVKFTPPYFVPQAWSACHGKSILRESDVLIVQTGDIGQVAMVSPDFIGANCHALIVVSPIGEKVSGQFLSLSLSSGYGSSTLKSIQTGALHPHLNCGTVRDVSIPLPPLDEQTQIAKFLDYETARIDALIEKQQQLIALLQEKRQAIISHTVTKGLNTDAPMRDSGVEWLGKVPAHWTIMNLNRVVDTFVDYRGRTPDKIDEGRPLVTAGAVRNGIVDLDRAPQYVSEQTYHQLRQRGLPEVGDILFTSEAPLGEVAVVEDVDIACAQRIIMFKVNRPRMSSRFLWLYLRSQAGHDEILTKSSGSTAEGIRADRLRRTRVPVPPLEEQERIVAHVGSELSGFDDILDAADRQTDLLSERRTALISAAVTGKIDVRSWKPPTSENCAEVA